jgi:hypothetical protein
MQEIVKTLRALLCSEPHSNFAALGIDERLKTAIADIAKAQEGRFVDLGAYDLARLPFGGEYFENIIIGCDAFDLPTLHILQLKKALQKNRHLIVISPGENRWSLEEKLESPGFSDFSTITLETTNVTLAKKWFTFAQ